MSNPTTFYNHQYSLDEEELVKQLHLLGEIQRWLNGVSEDLNEHISFGRYKESKWDNIYLTAAGFYDILSEHHQKIQKQSGVARFTIPVIDLMVYLKEAASEPIEALAGTRLFQTIINSGKMIGYDRNNYTTCFFTIISEAGGRIVTAYPGFSVNDPELFK